MQFLTLFLVIYLGPIDSSYGGYVGEFNHHKYHKSPSWLFPATHQKREVKSNLERIHMNSQRHGQNWKMDNLISVLYRHELPYSHELEDDSSSKASDEIMKSPMSELDLTKLTNQWYEQLRAYAKLLSRFQWRQFLQNNQHTNPNEKKPAKMKVNIPLLEAVIMGVKRAVAECQHQMKNERWNCSTLDQENSKNSLELFGNLLERGIPETAFVHSLINAGVMQSIAEACHQRIGDCPCDNRGRRSNSNEWQWYGCDHNIFYARKLTRKLFDSMEIGRNLKYSMNRHNNIAGRRNVALNMELYCRCHGASGSCTLKTCYRRIPTIRFIGNLLKQKYLSAVQMDKNRSAFGRNRRNLSNKFSKPEPIKNHLVYYENKKDIDFCTANRKFNIPGTEGRSCNSTQGAENSCNKLCCGRGHESKVVYEMENCNCKFVWCCKVQCEKCLVVKIKEKCF